MKFKSARCEICGDYRFSANEVLAYRVRDRKPTIIDLKGEEPWSGIRVICISCLAWLQNIA